MIRSRFCIFGLSLVVLTAASLLGQRRGGGSSAPAQADSSLVVHGSVLLAGGIVPEQLVLIEKLCGGRRESSTYADSKGRFSFDLGVVDRPGNAAPASGLVINAETMKACSLRATLAGYRPQSIPLEQVVRSQKTALGEMVLQPFGKQTALLSATDADVPKNARKDYEKGLDAVARAKWQDAIGAMEKATSGYPKFAVAWLSLGVLQFSQNDAAGALKSFAQAMAADDKFAPPFIASARVEAGSAQWAKVVEDTNKAISLDPDSFAEAYYLSAVANIRLNKADDARKSVAEGIRVDTDHEYTDLEYLDGFLLMNKNDREGARKRFVSYLAIAPNGTNAPNARLLLTELPTPK